MAMERRGFLKLLGLGAVAAVAAPTTLDLLHTPVVVPDEAALPSKTGFRILISQELLEDYAFSYEDVVRMKINQASDQIAFRSISE